MSTTLNYNPVFYNKSKLQPLNNCKTTQRENFSMETISNTKLNINAQSKMTKNKIVLSKRGKCKSFFIPTDNNYFDNNIKSLN